MRFDASQQMRLGQHMKLAPRMIQSMEILQMPLLQLEERIAQELESNVTLEQIEGEPGADPDAGLTLDGDESRLARDDKRDRGVDDGRPMTVDETNGTEDFARLESFEISNPEAVENERPDRDEPRELDYSDRVRSTRLDGEPDSKSEAMANTASRSASLVEQLQDQWSLADVDENLREQGRHIIAFIEGDGYLRTSLETILDRLPGAPDDRPTLAQMERALQAVQIMLDPPGTAARDTRECLVLQIDAMLEQRSLSQSDRAGWAIVRRLVAEHLDDLSQNRLPRIVERSGLSMDELKRAMERMHLLHLAPARQLVTEPRTAILPDAIVEYDIDADRYIAYLNESRMPNLRINQEYAALAKDKAAPKPTREFLKTNLSNAQWLMEAVEQRKRTLLRVINVVVDAQREYFDTGPQALRPLPMTQVAEQLGVHVATVSRAVADKYLLTPRGVVALRGFFSGGTQTHSGEEVSWEAIRAALKDIIDAEDKSQPLSDDALAEALSSRGIEIARRTVAKYRDQLSIPPARLRKQF